MHNKQADEMGKQFVLIVAALSPLVFAQSPLIITVAIRTCPVSASSPLTVLPTYSTLPYSGAGVPTVLSSMRPSPSRSPASSTVPTAGTPSSGSGIPASQEASSYAQSSPVSQTVIPIPIPSYASGDNLTSTEGNLYLYERDTALLGIIITNGVSGMRKRQNPDQDGLLFDCLEQCDGTPACVAVTLLGESCLLYAAVERTTYLLGAQAAFNLERYTGLIQDTTTSSFAVQSTRSTVVDYSAESSPASYLTSDWTGTRVSSTTAGTMSWTLSSVDPSTASSALTTSEIPISEAYSTPLLSTDHATMFTPPPSTTSVLSTVLAITISIPSSYLVSSSSTLASNSSRLLATSLRSASLPSSPMMRSSTSSSPVYSRSESPLLSDSTSSIQTARSDGVPSSGLGSESSSAPVSDTPPGGGQYTSDTAQSTSPASLESTEAMSSSSSEFSSETSAAIPTPEPTPESSAEPSASPQPLSESSAASSAAETLSGYESSSLPQEDGTITTSTTISSSVEHLPSVPSSLARSSSGLLSYSSSSTAISTMSSSSVGQNSLSSGGISSTSSSPLVSSPSSSSSSSPFVVSTTSSSSSMSTSPRSSSPSSSPSPRASSTSSRTSSSSAAITTNSRTTTSSSGTSSSQSSSSSSRAPSSSSSSSSRSSSSTPPVASATPVKNSGKRGLCYTNDLLTYGYSLSGQNSRVSWGYNYYYQNNTSPNSPGINPALNFVPLLFNDDPSLLAVWPQAAQKAIDNGADSLLGFNEPDLCYPGSACMTVNQSVIAWRNYMEPFAGKARLGAPAVTNGGPPSSLQWLGEFMGNCTGCTIDFVPIHWYSSVYAFSYLQYYVQLAYNVTRKPIWVTEFGIDASGGSEAQYQSFLQMALPWLDAVPYVERYAYFYDGPGYLINSNGSGLSAQGMIYNSYTAPCPNWQNSAGHC